MRKMYIFAILLIGTVILLDTPASAQISNPSSISGLRLWLAADTNIVFNGSAVNQWRDISGNGNHASQSTATQQPGYLSNVNLINHKPAVLFDGTNDSLGGVPLAGIDTGSVTMFLIMKGNSPTNTVRGVIKPVASANGLWLYENGANPQKLGFKNGSDNNTTLSAPAGGYPYRIIELVKRVNAHTLIYANQQVVLDKTTAAPTAAVTGGAYVLGGRYVQPFHGEMAEIIIYNSALDSTTRRQVENYLFAKYAPPVNLGPDIVSTYSFCPIKISAGNRFVSQLWSTGETTDTIQVTDPGTYWVTATDVFGRVSSDTIQVTFPSTQLNQPSGLFCLGGSTTLTPLLSSNPAYSYLWQDNTTTTASFNVTVPGAYQAIITDTFGCSRVSNTVIMAYDSFSVKATLGADKNLCSGNKVTLAYPPNNWVGYGFNWNTGSVDSFALVTVSGNYSVTVTNPLGCVARDTIHITMLGMSPQVNFDGDTLCLGDNYDPHNTSVSLDAAAISGYSWNFGNAVVSTAQSPLYMYPLIGLYSVQLTVSTASGCSNSSTRLVLVKPSPVADFAPATACLQMAYHFADGSIPPAGSTLTQWNWTFGDGGTSSQQTPFHTYSTTGTQQVSLIVNAANGCSDTVIQSVNVQNSLPLPGPFAAVAPVNGAQTMLNTVKFLWRKTPNAVGYRLLVSQDSSFASGVTQVYTWYDTLATVSLSNGTWYWKVRMYNACGDSLTGARSYVIVFKPNDILRMRLWLAADTNLSFSGSSINQWRDISGNNNHAAQATPAEQPGYLSNVNLINHKPSVVFDGTNDSLVGVPLSGIDTGSVSMFMIMKGNSPTNTVRGIIKPVSGASGIWFYENGANPQKFGFKNGSDNNTSQLAPAGGYPYQIIELVKQVNSRTLLYDNQQVILDKNTAAATAPVAAGPYILAGRYVQPFRGEMAEVIIYNSALDSFSRRKVENYLFEKYAPPVNLGPDIVSNYSLCPVKLTAGNRFVSQVWSTGETTDTIVVTASGNYWVTAIDVFGRVSRDTVYVQVGSVHLNQGSGAFCLGGGVSLMPVLNTYNNYTYTWQDNSTHTASYSVAMPGNYFVAITDTNGCTRYSDTIALYVDSFALKATLGGDTALCAGNKLSLAYPASNWLGYTFNWSTGSTDSVTVINTSGAYALTVTNAGGCSATDVINVTINGQAPLVLFNGDTLCLGEVYVPQNNSVSQDASLLNYYKWSFGTGDTSTQVSPGYLYAATGIYTVTLTVGTTAGCFNSATQPIIVKSVPVASMIPATACAQSSYQFMDNSQTAIGTTLTQWQWNFGDGGASSAQNPPHTYATPGLFTVSLAVTSSTGCSDTITQQVQVISTSSAPSTALLVSPANGVNLANGNATFQWSAAAGAANYALLVSSSPAFNVNTSVTYTTQTQVTLPLGQGVWYWMVRDYNICNDSANSAVRNLTVFAPGNLSNLVLWLAADTGLVFNSSNPTQVAQWRDLSGNGNHANQGTATEQPGYLSNINLINYKPTVVFDGTNDSLAGLPLNGIDTGSVTMFLIMKGNSPTATVRGIVKPVGSGGGLWLYENGANPQRIGYKNGTDNNTTQLAPAGGYPYTILELVKRVNAHTLIYANQQVVFDKTTAAPTAPVPAGPYILGGRYAQPFRGEMAEVIIYHSALDSNSRRTVENYLFSKYAPPVNLGADRTVNYSLCPVVLDAGNRFVSYAWSTGETIAAINVRNSGSYSVTAVDVFGRISSDTVNITMPYLGMNIGDTIFCAGGQATVTAQFANAPYTFNWYLNDTTAVYSNATAISPSLAGDYFAFVKDTNNCTFITDTVSLQIDSFAFASLIPTDTTICDGNTLVADTGTYTPVSFVWSNGATTPAIVVTASGNISVTVTDKYGCVAQDAGHINKGWVAPLTDFSANTVCLGDTLHLADITQPLTPDQIKTRLWDVGDTGTYTQSTLNYYFELPGTYPVSLTVTTDSGCTGYVKKFIKVSNQPVASFSYNGPVCAGTTLSFLDNSSVTGGDIISNWTWTFNNTNVYTTKNVAYAFPVQGMLPVQLAVTSNQGCSDTVTQTVEVFAYFEAGFDYANVCLGDVTQFTDQTQSLAVVSWTWDFGDGNASLTQNPQHTYATPNNYQVVLLAENAIGCVDTAIRTVSIVQPPVVDFNGNVACYAQLYAPQDITVSPNEPITAWRWNIDGTHYNVQAPQHQFTDSGTYQVQLIVTTQSGCVDSLTKSVSVKSNPLADFGIYPLYGEAPATITFTNLSEGASTYQWYFGDGSLSNEENPSYTFLSNDTFTISLVAYSQYGCSDSTSRVFIVAPTTLDVAVTNVETDLKPLSDGTIEVTVKARLSNLGTRVITDLKLYATIGSGGVFTEDWSGLLYSGLTTPYTFSAKFIISADHAATYVCVEAKEVNKGETEVTTDNNKQCVSLNDAIQLVGPSPNPSSDHATLGIILPKAGTVAIAVVNNLGQYVLAEKNYDLPAGRSDYEVPIEGMRAGEYYIRVKYNDDKLLRKFVVRR